MTKSDEWLRLYTLADYMFYELSRCQREDLFSSWPDKKHQAHSYIDVMNNALGMYFSCLWQEEQTKG